MKRLIFLPSLLFLLFLSSGCSTTSLLDKNIVQMKINLTDASGQTRERLIPGMTYRLELLIYTEEGELIDNPRYSEMTISSPNNTLAVDMGLWTVHISTTPDMFRMIHRQEFILDLKIKNHSFKKLTRKWEVHFKDTRGLNYGGRNGTPGAPGTAVDFSLSGEPVKVLVNTLASPGKPGEEGGQGENISFLVTYYDAAGLPVDKGNTLLLFYDIKNNAFFITTPGQVTIDASGGAGGAGGRGGSGFLFSSPGPYSNTSEEITQESAPGSGGDGGNGGDGGTITLFYMNENIPIYYITCDVSGGEGGRGGEIGEGLYPLMTYARKGRKGMNGTDGVVNYQFITYKEGMELLERSGNPYLEPERVIQ